MYEDTKQSEIRGRILGADIVITNKKCYESRCFRRIKAFETDLFICHRNE